MRSILILQGQRIADSLSAYFGVPYHFYQSFTHLSWNNRFREYIGIVSKYPVQKQGFHLTQALNV